MSTTAAPKTYRQARNTQNTYSRINTAHAALVVCWSPRPERHEGRRVFHGEGSQAQSPARRVDEVSIPSVSILTTEAPHRHGRRASGAASDTQAGVGLSAIGRATRSEIRVVLSVLHSSDHWNCDSFFSSLRCDARKLGGCRAGKGRLLSDIPCPNIRGNPTKRAQCRKCHPLCRCLIERAFRVTPASDRLSECPGH